MAAREDTVGLVQLMDLLGQLKRLTPDQMAAVVAEARRLAEMPEENFEVILVEKAGNDDKEQGQALLRA